MGRTPSFLLPIRLAHAANLDDPVKMARDARQCKLRDTSSRESCFTLASSVERWSGSATDMYIHARADSEVGGTEVISQQSPTRQLSSHLRASSTLWRSFGSVRLCLGNRLGYDRGVPYGCRVRIHSLPTNPYRLRICSVLQNQSWRGIVHPVVSPRSKERESRTGEVTGKGVSGCMDGDRSAGAY